MGSPIDRVPIKLLNGAMHAPILRIYCAIAGYLLLATSSNAQGNWMKQIKGSPEPALQYVAKRIWEKLPAKKPLELKQLPGRPGWMVYADHHESKESISSLWAFETKAQVAEQVEVLTLTNRLVYGFCFHPRFEENGFIFLHTSGPRRGEGSKKKKCRVSRWTMDRKTLAVDVSSHRTFLEWESNGHDGGGVVFGRDGMLYVTSGDGTSDSDVNLTGQRIDLILAKLLRINVDRQSKDRPYSIPPDNPFLKTPHAAPETWALGFRNPWRLTCDIKSGDIWVGENGQDLWESVKRVERGANYGWSRYEGSHPFYLERKQGPGKLTKPTFEHHHREARSLTGGVVYHGDRLPPLQGAYVYGDYSTGKIWAGRHDGQRVVWHQEIADTTLGITGFAEDARGNLIVIDDHTGFYRLEKNPEHGRPVRFPTRLSKTGLFNNTPGQIPAPGVRAYEVNVPHWTDGADAHHWIAVPEGKAIKHASNRGWNTPEGTVLVQTLFQDGRRLETRLLTKQQDEWAGYSYLWDKNQKDAVLVGSAGKEIGLSGGRKWKVPSRAECMMCHSRAVRYTLGLTELQMNRPIQVKGKSTNQIADWIRAGLLEGAKAEDYGEGGRHAQRRLPNPYDESLALESRVRAYWQANCTHCHVEAGGGNAQMKLEWNRSLKDTGTVDVEPLHSRFQLGEEARIVASGDIVHTVMMQRISGTGTGRMPPVGGVLPDPQWVQLLVQWVSELKRSK